MNRYTAEQLYNLLPAVYRIRDFELGEPLKALFTVLAQEAEVVESDIHQLYENLFIETCDAWVVPYIGDMLGVRGLSTICPTLSQRGYVANTLRYRRRKGTLSVLEQLAFDVTGWPAKAVEYFKLLSTSQHINHIRLENLMTPDIRQGGLLDSIGTPFDTGAHLADVRHISRDSGRYNVANIGLFIWRLQAYTLERVQAFSHGDGRFSFSPLGNDQPLFNSPESTNENTGLAERINVPDQLDRRTLYNELEEVRRSKTEGREPDTEFFGASSPFEIFLKNGDVYSPMQPDEIVICNLTDWNRPPASKEYPNSEGGADSYAITVAVDPELGRIVFPGNKPGQVFTTYTYCFSGDIGGGPYDRPEIPEKVTNQYAIKTIDFPSEKPDPDSQTVLTTLREAIAACDVWAKKVRTDMQNSGATKEVIAKITLKGNQIYEVSGGLDQTEPYHLIIQAAKHCRPVVRAVDESGSISYLAVSGPGESGSMIMFDGLLICGGIKIGEHYPGGLVVTHCTLVPGLNITLSSSPEYPEKPSIIADSLNTAGKRDLTLAIDIEHCILGPVFLPEDDVDLTVSDSIIDSPSWNVSSHHEVGVLVNILERSPEVAATGESRRSGTRETQQGSDDTHTPDMATQSSAAGYSLLASAHPRRTIPAGNKALVVLGGCNSTHSRKSTASEPTLSDSSGRPVDILVSSSLSTFPAISSHRPSLNVYVGSNLKTVTFEKAPNSLEETRTQLEDALRTHGIPSAHVAVDNDRLAVFTDEPNLPVHFGPSSADRTTVKELGLVHETPAIASSAGGDNPGPPVTLERVSVFGSVNVRECTLASNVILTGPMTVKKHQTGCVRFSYVPACSDIPARYHCQPDYAVSQQAATLRQFGITTSTVLTAEEARIRSRIVPVFSSDRYGDPGFAQLGFYCDDAITKGAEDSLEMGAFYSLMQPNRDESLRIVMDEYLRLGLELGIIYVT